MGTFVDSFTCEHAWVRVVAVNVVLNFVVDVVEAPCCGLSDTGGLL